jgi:serine phosphatase RsbU (regulator of sigma subunit)
MALNIFGDSSTGTGHSSTGSGVPLGFQGGATYPETEVALEPGDILLFCTHGLADASRAGEKYANERLWELLDRHWHRRAVDVV